MSSKTLTRRLIKQSPLARSPFRIGQSVVVSSNEDFIDDYDIVGRVGWIKNVTTNKNDELLFEVEWDAETLRSMSMNEIDIAEREGFKWDCDIFTITSISPSLERGPHSERTKAIAEVKAAYKKWYADNLNERVKQMIGDHVGKDLMVVFEQWQAMFAKKLRFPFEAIYRRMLFLYPELIEVGSLKFTEIKVIKLLSKPDPKRGVMAQVRSKGHQLNLPVCEIDLLNEDKIKNLIDLYCDWCIAQNLDEDNKN